MTRTTKKSGNSESGRECIAYQIADVVKAMSQDAGVKVRELRVDGGPTRNKYLMQFQSDIRHPLYRCRTLKNFPASDRYAAGLALGIWDEAIFENMNPDKI